MKCRLCINAFNKDEPAFELHEDDHNNAQITKIITRNITIEEPVESYVASSKICMDCFAQLDAFRLFCNFIESKQNEFLKHHLSPKSLAEELDECQIYAPPQGGESSIDSNVHIPIGIDNNAEALLDIKDVLLSIDKGTGGANEVDALNYGENPTLLQDVNFENDYAAFKDDEEEYDEDEKEKFDVEEESHSKRLTRRKSSLKRVKCVEKYKRNEDVVKAIIAQKGKNETVIAEHLRLKCEICDLDLETFLQLKKHFRQAHNTRGYVTCCDKKYYKSGSLADHIQLHIDPDAFKCKECGKNLRSKSCLHIHIRNKHVNKEQLRFVCNECGRRFAHSTNLKAHALTHDDKREFICEFCEKGFKTNYSLSVHVLAVHKDTKPFICDICGADFKMKAAFDRHIAEHKGIKKTKPAVQCSICDKWLLKYNLKKHLDTHDKTEVQCPQCDKLLSSKSSLTSHLKYVHSKKPSLKCTFCAKHFKQRSNLQEHIAMHTGTKDHSCPHCEREFRSKANMYVHIKRNHVDEWMQAQLARNKLPPEIDGDSGKTKCE